MTKTTIEDYAKQLQDQVAEQQAVIDALRQGLQESKNAFNRITEVKWGYDGDCGADNIAECAIYDIDDLLPSPPTQEPTK